MAYDGYLLKRRGISDLYPFFIDSVQRTLEFSFWEFPFLFRDPFLPVVPIVFFHYQTHNPLCNEIVDLESSFSSR